MKKVTILFAVTAFFLLTLNAINAGEYRTYRMVPEKDVFVYSQPSSSSALVCVIPQGANATLVTSHMQTPTSAKDQWYYVEYAGKGGYTFGKGTMIAGGK